MRDAIESLYSALQARDGEAVAQIVDANFHDDVVLHEPADLPWGGDHEGIKRVKRMFLGMATAPPEASPIAADTMQVQRLADGGDEVVVELAFQMTLPGQDAADTRAVEWFSVRDGKVVDVTARYFNA